MTFKKRTPGVMRTSRTSADPTNPWPSDTPVGEVDNEYRVTDDSLTENYDEYVEDP